MARLQEQQLYQALTNERFGFVQRGRRHIDEVYRAVQGQHPQLCDDEFLCQETCANGHNQPEWQHVTRKALEALKSPNGAIRKDPQRYFWIFA